MTFWNEGVETAFHAYPESRDQMQLQGSLDKERKQHRLRICTMTGSFPSRLRTPDRLTFNGPANEAVLNERGNYLTLMKYHSDVEFLGTKCHLYAMQRHPVYPRLRFLVDTQTGHLKAYFDEVSHRGTIIGDNRFDIRIGYEYNHQRTLEEEQKMIQLLLRDERARRDAIK